MRLWRVEVEPIAAKFDSHGASVLADLRDFGIGQVQQVRSSRLFLLVGQIERAQVERIAGHLLADPVTERYCISGEGDSIGSPPGGAAVEVHLRAGVMDPVAASTLRAVRQMGLDLQDVRTARRYVFVPAPTEQQLQVLCGRVLANECIEQVFFGHRPIEPPPRPSRYELEVRHVALRQLDDRQLEAVSRRMQLFLSLQEMQAIRDHYCRLGREPTDVELETLAQTWSEHCVHKTFKSPIVYRGPAMPGRAAGPEQVELRYDNLLAETIMRATEELIAEGRAGWCLSVFKDNAGVIEFDDDYGIAFKVETHNHPSAIEPYGGAATGIGGVIRDIIGCGLGARPIANTDVFCFGLPQMPLEQLPRGVLHPRRVMKGVVAGVRDYGNRMGIPTVNGAICFDQRYLGNPLVFCGCVGLIPKKLVSKAARSGDWIVLVGGRTGRDGIHGATFSSAELSDAHYEQFSQAVQIGDAITEKMFVDVLLQARDHRDGCLYRAITDCGAGGLSSAIGEMGSQLGAVVDLEKVPLKYAGLRYDEIWISEAQERMVLAVPPEKLDTLLGVLAAEDVEATPIGRFSDDRRLVLRFNGTVVGQMEMEFLHHGLPRAVRIARWEPGRAVGRVGAGPVGRADLGSRLKSCLAGLNVASKQGVIRQYDHEVQGASVVKPLVGARDDGPSDAAVLRPRLDSQRGIALGCGLCPELGDVDPYWMAVAAIDEAIRNVVCVGADPDRTAILDNFCWGNCAEPTKLGGLVRAAQGCYDAAKAYGVPFVSGKDSLNNEFAVDPADRQRLGLPERISIPPTLLISAVGIVRDVSRCVTMDLKQPGNLLVLAGLLTDRWELFDLEQASRVHRAVAGCIRQRLVVSAHDCSEAGAGLAVAEMAIAGLLGAQCYLPADVGLSDPLARLVCGYVLEVGPQALAGLQAALNEAGVQHVLIGRVQRPQRLQWYRDLRIAPERVRRPGRVLMNLSVAELRQAWQSPLQW